MMIRPIPTLALAAAASLSLVTIAEAFDFPAQPVNPGPLSFQPTPPLVVAPPPPPPPPPVVEAPVRHKRVRHKVVQEPADQQ